MDSTWWKQALLTLNSISTPDVLLVLLLICINIDMIVGFEVNRSAEEQADRLLGYANETRPQSVLV